MIASFYYDYFDAIPRLHEYNFLTFVQLILKLTLFTYALNFISRVHSTSFNTFTLLQSINLMNALSKRRLPVVK